MKNYGVSNKFITLGSPIWVGVGVALIAESDGRSPVGEFSKFIAVQCLYSAVITNVCNEKKIGNFITLGICIKVGEISF